MGAREPRRRCGRIEVQDANDALPLAGSLDDPTSRRGRGIAIVNKVADTWGVAPLDAGGKGVWFALALPADRPAS